MSEDPSSQRPAGVTLSRPALVWSAVGVVVLALVAALVGGWVAGLTVGGEKAAPPVVETTQAAEPTQAPPEEPDLDDLEDLIDDILPAGADVRVGNGPPSDTQGAVGDVYINLANSDVYVRRDGGWERVGNVRVDAAENLRGEQGEQGQQGQQGIPGSPGERGDPGQDGTHVVLGAHSPDADEVCAPDGSIYIDTSQPAYYSCTDSRWVAFGG